MASIADILIAKGNAQAQAASQRGNIYADLIRNLSSLPGQVIQNQRATEQQNMERQRLQSQIQSAASQQQLDALKVADAQRQGQERSALDAVWGDPTVYQPDGTLNRDGLRQRITAANMGHLLPTALEVADRLDESRTQLQQKQQALSESYRETLGKDALELERAGNDPGVFHLIVADRAKTGVIPKEQADALLKMNDPAQVAAITSRWKAGSAAGKPKLRDVAAGTTVFDDTTGKAVFTAPSKAGEGQHVINGQLVGPEGQPIGAPVPKQEDATEAALQQARLKEINARLAGTIPLSEKDRAELGMQRARLEFEKTKRTEKPASGAEKKALSYYNRAAEALDTLTSGGDSSLENQVAKAGLLSQVQLQQPLNILQTEDQQRYRQAQRAFTESRLRKESGAQVPKNEYEQDAKTYFAQPGDSAATIKQKAHARQTVLNGIKFEAGKAYEEFYDEPNTPPSRASGRPETTTKPTTTLTPGLRGLAGR